MLRVPGFRPFLLAAALARFSTSALAVLLGVTVYQLAHDPLALAWLGLSMATPAIALVLFGGHVADRHNRRIILILARLAMAILCSALAAVAVLAAADALLLLYAVAFLIGCVGAFANPASAGVEAQVVPVEHALRGASVLASTGQVAGLLGAPLGGFGYDLFGPAIIYPMLGLLCALSALALWQGVPARAAAPAGSFRLGMLANIAEGIRAVFADQRLIGSMALDLFAIFFGGVIGLLPLFATDILGVGSAGAGLLRAAASAGTFVAIAITLRHPPRRHAGIALHLAIAGFGLGIIVFGLSTNFALSLAALAFTGACDGVSVVVRQALVRLLAPEHMRGRIAAVRMVFVNSSNELGDVESGIAASLIGAAPAVALGGVITIATAALTAWRAPKLLWLDIGRVKPPGDHKRSPGDHKRSPG